MKLTVDISLYPLNSDYIPIIKEFIAKLNKKSGLTIVTNALSTQVTGDYDLLMNALHTEMKHSHEVYGKSVFVCKFLHGELAIDRVPDLD
tara:strand:- start:1522 stop:1791 length:270 start_codon:yes stop_codon:yes gene_type:complete